MSLIPWVTQTFGQFGGALVLSVILLLGAAVARYAFWGIAAVLVMWKVRRNRPEDDQ